MKKLVTKHEGKFLIILLGVIVINFLLLQPKISTWLFPFKRQTIWQGFIQKVEKDKKIDARSFWEFREFYNPGSFVFERDGLSQKKVNEQLNNLRISLSGNTFSIPFLLYNSGKMESLELLVTTNELNKIINNLNITKNVIYKDSSSIIYKERENTVKIIFIKPTDEMVTANGFYNYRNKDDVKIYKDKYWLSISKIDL